MTSERWLPQSGFGSRKRIVSLGILISAALLAGAFIAVMPNGYAYLLGSIGVGAYIVLAYSRPFAAFMVLTFFALTVSLSSVKVVGDISAMVGLGLIFSLTWVSRLVFRAAEFVKVKEYGLLIGLSATVFVSALYNLDGPAGSSSTLSYLQLYLLFVLVINMVTTPSHLQALGGVIIASSTITAILILLDQYNLLPQWVIREQFTGVLVGSSLEVVSRTGGIWGDANFTAVQLAVALPFIIGWWPVASAWWKRVLLIGAAGTILAAFTLTLSTGGLLGLSTILLIKAVLDPKRNKLRMVFRVTLMVAIAVMMFNMLLPDLYGQRVLMKLDGITAAVSTQDSELLGQSTSGRADTWQAALSSIVVSPLLGHGAGNASFEIARHSVMFGDMSTVGAHNMFLSEGADLGLIGLVLFSVLLVSAILAVRPSLDSATLSLPMHSIGEALFVALLAYTVQGMALDIHNLKLLWILLGMAIAYRRISLFGKVKVTPLVSGKPR